MAFSDDILRILRDHEGYTGDGKGGVGSLPVGDRSTAKRPILKSDLRTAFLEFATVGEQAEGARDDARQAADDAAAVTSAKVAFYNTRSSAEAGTIPAYVDVIRVSGNDAIGDGGMAVYRRRPSKPAETTRFQSADGAWWSQIVEKPIFILATGQSNMQQHRSYTFTPAPNVLRWNNQQGNMFSIGTAFEPLTGDTMNPSISFANKIARENPESMVYLLNVAKGGMTIDSWLPGATQAEDVYRGIQSNIDLALPAAGVSEISAFLWWQGESGGFEADYPDDFETVQSRFRGNSWFPARIPTVVFGVTTTARAGENRYDQTNFVLQDIVDRVGSNRLFVDTASLTGDQYWENPVHMSGVGYDTVGAMAADAFLGKTRFVSYRMKPETPYLVDANLTLGTGAYQTDPATLNIPVTASGILFNTSYNSQFAVQTYDKITAGIRWRRHKRSGVWGAWSCIGASVLCSRTSTDQIVTAQTLTKILFNSVDSDPGGFQSNSTFALPAGKWHVTASYLVTNGIAAGDRLILRLANAALTSSYIQSDLKANSNNASVNLSGVFISSGNGSYVLAAYTDGASDITLKGSSEFCRVSFHAVE